jgi:4'-phosphopantetheinyl transferase
VTVLQAAGADVCVWWVDLDAPAADVARCAALLDPAERSRSARFHFPRDARRFTVARATLRTVLGELLGVPAQAVAFTYGPFGKPELDPARHAADVTFNASHSHGIGVIAAAAGRRIGVDVERVRALKDMGALARRVFSPRELEALFALPAGQQVAGFFNGWTRKEAFIKATGAGLSQPLDAFSVSLAPAQPADILEIGGDPVAAAAWSLHALDAPAGFAAALICEGRTGVPRIGRYAP